VESFTKFFFVLYEDARLIAVKAENKGGVAGRKHIK